MSAACINLPYLPLICEQSSTTRKFWSAGAAAHRQITSFKLRKKQRFEPKDVTSHHASSLIHRAREGWPHSQVLIYNYWQDRWQIIRKYIIKKKKKEEFWATQILNLQIFYNYQPETLLFSPAVHFFPPTQHSHFLKNFSSSFGISLQPYHHLLTVPF